MKCCTKQINYREMLIKFKSTTLNYDVDEHLLNNKIMTESMPYKLC